MSSDADFLSQARAFSSAPPTAYLNSHLTSHFCFFVHKPAVCHSPCFFSCRLPAALTVAQMCRCAQSHTFLVLHYQSLRLACCIAYCFCSYVNTPLSASTNSTVKAADKRMRFDEAMENILLKRSQKTPPSFMFCRVFTLRSLRG